MPLKQKTKKKKKMKIGAEPTALHDCNCNAEEGERTILNATTTTSATEVTASDVAVWLQL